jgi:hypothetical protein
VKAIKFRDLIRRLVAYDPAFQLFKPRGGGSHYQIYHPDIQGRAESYPIPFRSMNAEVKKGHLAAIRRRFRLPAEIFD